MCEDAKGGELIQGEVEMKKLAVLIAFATALVWTGCGSSNSGKVAYLTTESGNPVMYTFSSDGATSTKAPFTLPTDGFYFVANRDATEVTYCKYDGDTGLVHVYLMDSKGTEKQLSQLDSCYPTFTPDGKTVVFNAYTDGSVKIYTVKIDGTGEKMIVGDANSDNYSPMVSPNGAQILYFHYDYSNNVGTSASLWTKRVSVLRSGKKLDYSGTKSMQPNVTFSTTTGMYIAKIDGTGATEVVEDPNYDLDTAVFSSDGKSIYFGTYQFGSNEQIASVKIDGSSLKNVSNDLNNDEFWPAAYNGQIYFNRYDCSSTCNYEIFRMKADGSEKKNLTNTPDQDEYIGAYWD